MTSSASAGLARVAQHPMQGGGVAVLQAAEERAAGDRERSSDPHAEHRDDGLRDHERGDHRDDDRNRDVLHQDRDLARRAEHQRHEHDDRRQRAGECRDADLAHAAQCGAARIGRIELAVPEHALGDHHGVVHQHADGQHHAHHRKDVEREPEEVQRRERDQQRARYGERDDRSHRPVAQEEEQHCDREHQSDQAGIAQVAERIVDALGLVADDDDADALQLRQSLGALDLLRAPPRPPRRHWPASS